MRSHKIVMEKLFLVPVELLGCWWRLSLLYRDYIPEIQMDRDSFRAVENKAEAIFQQLQEMKLERYAERPAPSCSSFCNSGSIQIMAVLD